MNGFFGKTCNYAFLHKEESYHVFFLGDGQEEFGADFNNIDSCILWTAYQEFVEKNTKIGMRNALICEKRGGSPVMWLTSRDRLLEYVWQTLTDVNTNEDEQIEQDWLMFPAGTGREEIWHWFDEHYSRGVRELMHAEFDIPAFPWVELEKKDETLKWIFVKENSETDKEAESRVLAGLMMIDSAWMDSDNAAVLSVPSDSKLSGKEEITAAVYEDDEIPGNYWLVVYDQEELFGDTDAFCFSADGIREATETSSQMIRGAIYDKGDRVDVFRKRYLASKG